MITLLVSIIIVCFILAFVSFVASHTTLMPEIKAKYRSNYSRETWSYEEYLDIYIGDRLVKTLDLRLIPVNVEYYVWEVIDQETNSMLEYRDLKIKCEIYWMEKDLNNMEHKAEYFSEMQDIRECIIDELK